MEGKERVTVSELVEMTGFAPCTIRRKILADQSIIAYKVCGKYMIEKESFLKAIARPKSKQKESLIQFIVALSKSGFSASDTARIVDLAQEAGL